MAESSYQVIDEESLDKKSWKVIGAGAFGQVYKARHLQRRSDVAIKLLGLDDGSSSRYLLRECELMRRAKSPRVIQILGVFRGRPPSVSGIQIGLVMELMERGSLASLQRKLNHRLPWSLVFRLAHQVSLGMEHLHSLTPPIIHKDLKPDNVLLDAGLNVKITDFGISRFINCSTSANSKGGGTTSYMPPEAFSVSYKSTPAFDVYSYGILLCFIVTGKEPYETHPAIIKFQIPMGQRPSLEAFGPEQTPGLEDLVKLTKRCWHQEPDERPLFTECTTVTEKLYEKDTPGMKDAVDQVVTELDQWENATTESISNKDITQPSDQRCDGEELGSTSAVIGNIPQDVDKDFLEMLVKHSKSSAASQNLCLEILPEKSSAVVTFKSGKGHGGISEFYERRIVLVGKAGVGKSAAGNTILGREAFESELSPSSLTSVCKKAKGEVDGRRVAVIDTPALFDTNLSQEEVLRRIKMCISLSAPGPHAFLVVIQLGRFTQDEKDTVKIIQTTFGEASARHTMVLFTYGDKLKTQTIEDFVSESEDLGEIVRKCHGYHVFNNEVIDHGQTSGLLDKIDRMAMDNGGMHYTNEMFVIAEDAIEKEKARLMKESEGERQKELKDLRVNLAGKLLHKEETIVLRRYESKARAHAERSNDFVKAPVIAAAAAGGATIGFLVGVCGGPIGMAVGTAVGAAFGAAVGAVTVAISVSDKCNVQ